MRRRPHWPCLHGDIFRALIPCGCPLHQWQCKWDPNDRSAQEAWNTSILNHVTWCSTRNASFVTVVVCSGDSGWILTVWDGFVPKAGFVRGWRVLWCSTIAPPWRGTCRTCEVHHSYLSTSLQQFKQAELMMGSKIAFGKIIVFHDN